MRQACIRPGRSPRLFLLPLLAALIAFAALPAGAAAGPKTMTTGLSGLYNFGPEAMLQTQSTGAKFLRVVISWRAVAPVKMPDKWDPADPGDPAYNWRETDERFRNAVAAGFIPFALVTEAPAWAESCRPETQAGVCDPNPSAFATFAHAAAARYNGQFRGLPRVQYWQPINEPNLSIFFNPQFDGSGKPVSPDLYRVLLNRFYDVVKAVDPSNLVVGGALGPVAIKRYTIGPMQFTRQLLCMEGSKKPHRTKSDCEGGVHFDIFDIHPYTTGGPNHKGLGNDVQMGDLGKLQTLLKAAKRDGRIVNSSRSTPLWITEFSWDSKPPDPGGLAMKIESRWIAEAVYRAWQAGVSAFFWYGLYDDPPNPSYSASLQSGLYFAGPTVAANAPKPILYAFRFPLVAYPEKKGLSYWGRTFTGAAGRVVIQALDRGKWRKLAVAKANASGIFTGVVGGNDYGSDLKGSVRAVFRSEASVPFAMRPVKEFIQPPFG
jgi:hypothetical protein